jgi:predicted HD phosphohydrolase
VAPRGADSAPNIQDCLQTATRARRANATDELVLVAVVHDAAEVVSSTNHAELAAALMRPYVSERAYYIVRTHMEFCSGAFQRRAIGPLQTALKVRADPQANRAVREVKVRKDHCSSACD